MKLLSIYRYLHMSSFRYIIQQEPGIRYVDMQGYQ